jgi:glycosyltransferase involved in cell wall biosynthesis
VRVFHVQKRSVNERGKFGYLRRILIFLLRAFLFLARPSNVRRYDVIHVHNVPDFLIFAALLPKLFGTKIVLDIHDILPEFYASKFSLSPDSLTVRMLKFCERLSTAFSNHVIIANDLWRERLIGRAVTPDKVTTIRNYPDPVFFATRQQPAPHAGFLLMYPGTLNSHQGLDIAIRAFARLAPEMPDLNFHIYGEGPALPELRTLSDELGLAGRLEFFGFLPVKEIGNRMAQADLAVVPKRVSTGFGNEAASTKIMEFMSVGVPVVVSRTRIDSLEYGESVVHFAEPENDAAWAEAIRTLKNDPEYRAQLVANSFAYLGHHNWAKRKYDYLGIVDSLADHAKQNSNREVHAQVQN